MLGQEVIEGNGVVGFATPLATMHRFHGWADEFLTTPANGIDDRYVSVGHVAKGVALLKYAHYEAHEGRTPAAYQDTTKFWARLEYVR